MNGRLLSVTVVFLIIEFSALNLTFPAVPQYPRIFKHILGIFYLINCQFYLEFRVCLYLPPYLQEVGTLGRL